MSNIVTGITQTKRVGSQTRKAVLMFMAACASDDGTGVWTSKANMSADLEMARRTVQRCINDLIETGIISEVGHRSCRNGFTVEYSLDLDAIKRLETTRDTLSPVTHNHVTRDTLSPQDVTHCHPNRPLTIHEPEESYDSSLVSSPDKIDLAEAVASYNSHTEHFSWTKCQKLTPARAAKLKARLRDTGGIDGWYSALKRATESPYLRGEVNGFKMGLDFLLQESSFTKLTEGFYDERCDGKESGADAARRVAQRWEQKRMDRGKDQNASQPLLSAG